MHPIDILLIYLAAPSSLYSLNSFDAPLSIKITPSLPFGILNIQAGFPFDDLENIQNKSSIFDPSVVLNTANVLPSASFDIPPPIERRFSAILPFIVALKVYSGLRKHPDYFKIVI